MKELVIVQEVIDTLSPIGRRVMKEVLAMDWDQCLLTDLSSLSDFTACGDTPPEVDALVSAGQRAYCAAWDRWVLSRIETLYGLKETTTTTPLVQLLPRIEAALTPHTLQ